MRCPKCFSEKVVIQAVTETKSKGKGLFYWLILVWVDLVIWFFAFIPRLIVAIFRPKKIKSKTSKMAICQACGYSWKVK